MCEWINEKTRSCYSSSGLIWVVLDNGSVTIAEMALAADDSGSYLWRSLAEKGDVDSDAGDMLMPPEVVWWKPLKKPAPPTEREAK